MRRLIVRDAGGGDKVVSRRRRGGDGNVGLNGAGPLAGLAEGEEEEHLVCLASILLSRYTRCSRV